MQSFESFCERHILEDIVVLCPYCYQENFYDLSQGTADEVRCMRCERWSAITLNDAMLWVHPVHDRE